ncbi:MAG: signal peptidase II [Proteobacteria bacterium]|nr:signal peptidase II [Pseudomonadota bacterium]MBU1687267.1 signal peptidase II [Pseudomonadota bacterium]
MIKALCWVLVVVVADQLTKLWVVGVFLPYESKEVIPGFFNLAFVTNTGAAFGILAGEQNIWRQLFFVGVAGVALVVLVGAFRQYRNRGALHVAAIIMVAGGALGNLIDRLRLGHVIDFLDFYYRTHHWPAFNLADSAITVGVGLFLLATIREPEPTEMGSETHE